eukprot:3978877-Amphidinium_carterae.1
MDVRTPKSRKKCKEDSVGVSSQATPERPENSQKCCKCDATQLLRQCTCGECQHMACMNHREWIAKDAVSKRSPSSSLVIGERSDSSSLVIAEGSDSSSDEFNSSPQITPLGREEPEVTGTYVRAHQRTLPDGRIIIVGAHYRGKGKGKGKGRTRSVSPVRSVNFKGKSKTKGKGRGKAIRRSVSTVSSGSEEVQNQGSVSTVRSEEHSGV